MAASRRLSLFVFALAHSSFIPPARAFPIGGKPVLRHYLSTLQTLSSSHYPQDWTTTTTRRLFNTKENSAPVTILDTSQPDIITCREILATAEQAAKAAGQVIDENLGCSGEQDDFDVKANIKDIVTKYDKMAQDRVMKIVVSAYPDHIFLGEEDVGAGGEASSKALDEKLKATAGNYLWICDPIDGTANFASGMPICGVTMAVLYQGKPIVACIYDPHRDELFSTIKGQGAWLSTTLDTTGEVKMTSLTAGRDTYTMKLSDAIVNAGCPADPNAFAASMRGMMALNSKARGLRVLACSCVTLAWIASGRLSGHFGYDLSSWDLVAGAMLIQESGGHVTDLDGSDYRVETRNMLCTSNRVPRSVHQEILDTLDEADATSYSRVAET